MHLDHEGFALVQTNATDAIDLVACHELQACTFGGVGLGYDDVEC